MSLLLLIDDTSRLIASLGDGAVNLVSGELMDESPPPEGDGDEKGIMGFSLACAPRY